MVCERNPRNVYIPIALSGVPTAHGGGGVPGT